MRISYKGIRQVLLGSLLLPACVTSVVASPSLMMPKAEKSMMIDLDQVGSQVVAVGERGHILISRDSGKSWSQSQAPIDQMLTAVDFATEKTGWAVGHDGHIVGTSNGGESWELLRNGLDAQAQANQDEMQNAKQEVERLKKYVADVEAGLVVVEKIDPKDYPLDEYGYPIEPLTPEEELEEAQWAYESAQKRIHEDVVAAPLMDVWFRNENEGWAVGAFGNIVQTTDGGKTWISRKRDIGNPDNFHLNAVIGAGDSVYVSGEAGFLAYSLDKGATWQQADLGYDGTIFGLIAKSDGSVVIATGLRGNTFRSKDKGASWEQLKPGVDYSLAAGTLFGLRGLALVGTGGTIAISRNQGTDFESFTLPSRSSLSSVLPLKDGTLLLVGQGGIHRFDPTSAEKQE